MLIFFISSKRTVIELDGSQHGTPENQIADKKRDSDLKQLGITVLRYQNKDVNKNFKAVCEDILLHLGLQASDLTNSDSKSEEKNT